MNDNIIESFPMTWKAREAVESATIPLDPALVPKTGCFNPELHEDHPAVTKKPALDEGTKKHPFYFRVKGHCFCLGHPL